MTLTDLRYLVALARERHFGRAAERCHVSQPTLSIAVKKVEDELGLALFERHRHEVLVTPGGESIIRQAQRVLEEMEVLNGAARAARNQFAAAFPPPRGPGSACSCRRIWEPAQSRSG